MQDNGPGILKKQIPLIFGKLLYGSKFHRLRMSRGQQGIGISAAGMHGLLTTGKPVKIMSKVSQRDPAHYYEIQIDTKRNLPEILNGRGEGVEIPPNGLGDKLIEKHGIEWIDVGARHAGHHRTGGPLPARPRQRRRLSGTDRHRQPARGDPLHRSRRATRKDYARVTDQLPPEPKEIKPHPYGVELGRLVAMLKETKAPTVAQFLVHSFSRVSSERRPAAVRSGEDRPPGRTRRRSAGTRPTCSIRRFSRRRFPPRPPTALSPIGEELILKGLRQVVPGEFYAAATRPPAVYRGNPFQIEVGLAYGGAAPTHRVSREALAELLEESDARTLRQFLITGFQGLGAEVRSRRRMKRVSARVPVSEVIDAARVLFLLRVDAFGFLCKIIAVVPEENSSSSVGGMADQAPDLSSPTGHPRGRGDRCQPRNAHGRCRSQVVDTVEVGQRLRWPHGPG